MDSTQQIIQIASKPMHRLLEYLHPHRVQFRFAISNSFINKVLDLAPPVLVGWSIDTVTGNTPALISTIAGQDQLRSAATLAGLAIFIFGFESLFEYLYERGFRELAQKVQHRLRMDTYERMQQREMRFFEEHRLGETMSILSDDINQLERFLNSVFNDIIQIISLFIISGFILFNASPQLSIVAISPIPIIVVGSLWFQKLLTPRYQKIREAVGWVNTRLENNLGGIAVIKSFTAEDYESERLRQVSQIYRDRNFEAIKVSALFTPLIRMGVVIGFAGVLFMGALWAFEGRITAGTFTLFGMLSQRILWPLTRLGTILDETERCRASAARIFGLLQTPSQIIDQPKAIKAVRVSGLIEFDKVHFSYHRGNEVLRGLSFKINPQETVGIAGSTGSGKSTLIKILLRLYEVQHGEVRLDGRSINDLTLASLRQQISLVSQDVYVFQGTIAENIAYGSPNIDLSKVRQAAQSAQLDKFVNTLPDGYHTLVGERGIKLSGGQRQRLSIARALLKDAPILILDEATSSVDTETERDIQEHLDNFTANKTALIIAHRLSTIRNADRILVLEQGRVCEEGTHHDLVCSGGVYADLWALQSGEKVLSN